VRAKNQLIFFGAAQTMADPAWLTIEVKLGLTLPEPSQAY
jgi:hypothetical protein